MAHIDGRKCFLTLGGTLLQGIMNSNFDMTVEYVDATTNDSDGHEEGLAGQDAATGTVDGRCDKTHTYGVTQARTAALTKAAIALIWGPGVDVAGERVLSCNVILTGVNETAAPNNTINYSISWRKTGSVSEGTSATTKT